MGQNGGREGTGFAARLVALRERKKWTQSELARQAGVSRQNVSRWEAGTAEPVWSAVLALAAALGVRPNAFLPKDDAG